MTGHISAPERAFDFWVGEWDVHRSDTGELVGRNVITRLHGGRVLAESYTTVGGGFSGSSLNGFDSESGRWHQCWMDSAGLVLDIYGAWSTVRWRCAVRARAERAKEFRGLRSPMAASGNIGSSPPIRV